MVLKFFEKIFRFQTNCFKLKENLQQFLDKYMPISLTQRYFENP